MTVSPKDETILQGIDGSPGICIGQAYLVDNGGVDVIKQYTVESEYIPEEIVRFKTAIKKAESEINSILEKLPDELDQHASILETHKVLLKDKMLYRRTIETIKSEFVNAEWALKKVVAQVKSMFYNMADTYLGERALDIQHVSDRIQRNLVGGRAVNFAGIDKRVILVAKDLSPADTSQLQLERIMGFVTDQGGKASHTMIIAQTLEIPAVLGLGNATKLVNNDDIIIVDGTNGVVIINPDENTLVEFWERKTTFENQKAEMTRNSYLPAKTLDGIHVDVLANIELSEEVVSVIDHGGDGIGLYRTEFQYLNRSAFPNEDELFECYRDVVDMMAPKPVTIRTLDINGDKAVVTAENNYEENPALGLRAIRYCLKNPEIFMTQLRAILRAAVYGNVRIIFPLISTKDEIIAAISYLDQAGKDLTRKGAYFNRDVKVGIMIEVPSAVIMADTMTELVDFFSIGTNDLIQYSLAIDRSNRDVADLYSALNPAILRMLKNIATVAHEKGIEVYMCGEMAADPLNIPILLGLGLDELSMNPASIPAVKSMIRHLDTKDAQKFLNRALTKTSVKEITELVQATYECLLSEKIYCI